jgi:phosphotransferase system enzyme I (PtsI)
MAGDPLAAMLLVGLGMRHFSMEPTVLPEIKEALRRVSLPELEEVAAEVMQQTSAEDVEHLLASQFAHRLIDLLSGDD